MTRILAIDDKKDNLVALSALLKSLLPDCAVITAQSGREGIAKAKAEQPDAILLDIVMPDMDGFETCRRLMSEESTSHIPVIMITAIKTDTRYRTKGMEIGANAFLAKPIDEVELLSQVKVALRIKAAEDALRTERDVLEKAVQERTAHLQQEIIKHKRSEEERLASEIKFREIFNKSIDAIGVSRVGVHEFVNPAYATLFGFSSVDDLVGKPVLELIAPREHATIQDRIKRRAQGEPVPSVYETWGMRRDGTEFIMDVHASSYEMFGATYTLVIMRDITELKNAEEALLRSEKAAKRLAQENELIAEVGRIISLTLNTEEVYESFAEKVREAIPFDRIAVNIVNKEDNNLTIRYVKGDTFSGARVGQVLSLFTTATDQVIRTRSSLLINSKNREALMGKYSGMQSLQAGAQSGMIIPLISQDEVIASMVIYSVAQDAYTENDMLLAERVGSQIAGAIANSKLFLERKQAEALLEEEHRQLKQALEEVRTLRGIVPICAHCKKIRDDQGFWNQVEQYVSDHSEAKFSHGICPTCFEKEMKELKA